jgi:hypothetical protein
MISLFLLESFYLRPKNQYILVMVIPSFPFYENAFVLGKSPVKV